MDDTALHEWYFESATPLKGLPASAVVAAKSSAESKGKPGYRLTLDGPSFSSAMMYLDDRALREALYCAQSKKSASGVFDNSALLAPILALRKEKAQLLGFANFADLVLDNRMAKNGNAALAFVSRIEAGCRTAFEAEAKALATFAHSQAGPEMLSPWDLAYYAEKQRIALYDLDEEALRPYFELSNVLGGVFKIASDLYGLTFEKQRTEAAAWHADVTEYAVKNARGDVFATFFLDWFPREGKRDGAWMHGIVDRVPNENGTAPHKSVALVVGNMTMPQDGVSLLTHREVETVFHEFGHLLHHLLSEVPVRSLAGTKVAWDFVELPSQIMENFCWDKNALKLFAKHYKTGEVLPDSLFERVERAKNFRAATAIMRQLGFAKADLLLHTSYDPATDGKAIPYARAVAQSFIAAELPEDYAMIASFLHLFSSPVGYAAADADAYALFVSKGILSREVGEMFRSSILSKGDSEDPSALFRAFRGRDPDEQASLRRAGLVA
jgi:oligopeptidase A